MLPTPNKEEVNMSEFNPLQDFATFLGSIAKGLPSLPPPPFPLPQPPEVRSSDDRYVDVSDHITDRQFEKHREEQRKRGLVVLNYQ